MTTIIDSTFFKKTEILNWDLKSSFNISRGSKTSISTILLNLSYRDDSVISESVPYGHYGESVESVFNEIESFNLNYSLELSEILRNDIREARKEPKFLNYSNNELISYLVEKRDAHGIVSWQAVESIPTLSQIRRRLNRLMRPGAARNALDCALWQLEGFKVELPETLPSSYTIVLDSPEKMIKDAIENKYYPTIKVKVDRLNLDLIIPKIREVCPKAKIILDANESFSFDTLRENMKIFVQAKIDLIEQPLPADKDHMLEFYDSPIPLCADESFHTYADFKSIKNKYHAVNIKLDKTGGLTEATRIAKKAKKNNLLIMLGCMVCSSISIWPILQLYKYADFIDLDGPRFLKNDSIKGSIYPNTTIKYENGMMKLNDIKDLYYKNRRFFLKRY